MGGPAFRCSLIQAIVCSTAGCHKRNDLVRCPNSFAWIEEYSELVSLGVMVLVLIGSLQQ